jgi:hypothetical protein
LRALRNRDDWHRDDAKLVVVVDGDSFEEVWGDPDRGRLDDLDWRLEDPQTATYADPLDASGHKRLTAIRVR